MTPPNHALQLAILASAFLILRGSENIQKSVDSKIEPPKEPNNSLLPNWRDRRRFDGSLMILDGLTVVHVSLPASGKA